MDFMGLASIFQNCSVVYDGFCLLTLKTIINTRFEFYCTLNGMLNEIALETEKKGVDIFNYWTVNNKTVHNFYKSNLLLTNTYIYDIIMNNKLEILLDFYL